MSSLSESLTEYFYQWEERGRGWYLCVRPVRLEPPFTPFLPPTAVPKPLADDGLNPMPIKALWKGLTDMFSQQPKADVREKGRRTLATLADTDNAPLCTLSVSLPRDLSLSGYEAEQVLLMLSYCKHPVSFELVGTKGSMRIQIACSAPDEPYVVSQFKTFYPSCTVLSSEDALDCFGDSELDTVMLDFGLRQEFMRPLAIPDRKTPSPYLGLSGVFDVLRDGECACIQVLFQGATRPWTRSIMRSVTDACGDSFFADAPEMPKLAARKVSSQLFAVVVRVMAATGARGRTDDIMSHLAHGLIGQTASACNSLIPLSIGGYNGDEHFKDIISRKTRRFGMLLNTEELALLAHVTDESLLIGKLASEGRKTRPAPEIVRGHEHLLGTNRHQGVERPVSVSVQDRFTHMHVIGATGTGKSTFLLNGIVQDIRNGNGVAVLDPHGDLIEAVINYIPEHRKKDVIVIDPSDNEYSVGFNIVSANTELEKEVLSSDLVSMFQRFSTSWGDQMNSVLANALLAFLENTERGTLLDVRRFLLEQSFREKILKTVTDQSVIYYWKKEFPIIKTNSISSILTRLDSFLRPKAIRYIVGQKQGLNFDDILNSQKILLVKLSHGLIGESNSYLLGSLVVSKIYQTALARQSTAKDGRKNFFVYIDEFQHFITPSLSHVLSGGRKYNVGLVLAHQSLEQISKSDSELASSLIANAGIRICFRLGESDAQKLEKGFASFAEEDLLNLGTGEAICRIGRSDMDFNLSVLKNIPASDQTFISPGEVIRTSREKYGVLRSGLEEMVNPKTEYKIEEKVYELVVEASLKPVEVPKPEGKKEAPAKPAEEVRVIEDPQLVADMVRRKEESRHKYLQMLIKRNAESRGYKATLEQPTKDGKGRVDIVLQKDKITYAVEVGVTTTKEWEVHNIEKCLTDGFINIIALSEDMKGADLMARKLTECGILPKDSDRVRVYDMTGFMGVLNAEDIDRNPKTRTIKGYRVKVEYGDER